MKNAKISPHRAGTSAAVAAESLSLTCLLLVILLPKSAMTYAANSLFHTLDVSQIATKTPDIASSAVGLAIAAAIGYLIGAVFAITYNRVR